MKASFKKLAARTGAVAALASSMAFALPAFAFAAEKKTSGIAAILPTMDEFIPMLVAFLILLAILAKWGWPMFDKVLVKRENTIRAALEQAEENRIESDRVLKEYQDRLIDAREEASTIVSEAQRAEITSRAQDEADRIIAKARETIKTEQQIARGELQASVADIAVAAMAKVVEEDFSDADHRRLIERSIEEVGNLNA